MEQVGFFANEIISRLDSILKKSAEIFQDGTKISVLGKNHYELPEFNGFLYSFEFEDCMGFVIVDWFKADSTMRTFSVELNQVNYDEIEEKFVRPILNSLCSELRVQFLAKISDFKNIQKNNSQILKNFDLKDLVVLQLNLLQLSPDDKKVIKLIFPKELLLSLLCIKQFPDLETLNQSQIDGIVENYTQKENVISVDFIPRYSNYSSIDKSDFELPIFSEKEQLERETKKLNCERLSFFMESVARKMYKDFHDYRENEFNIKVHYSTYISDFDFSSIAKDSVFLVSSKIGGYTVYLCWDKVFFTETFLGKEFNSKLEKVECEIFKNEFATPAFEALKSIIEYKVKKYLVVNSISFSDFFEKNKNILDKESNGLLVEFSLKSGRKKAIANFYFPKDSIPFLESAEAFSDLESEKIINWQFPVGQLKNTTISLGAFIFDESKFNSRKTFVLEKEIGDTVEVFRDSKLIARGEVFIKNGKKCILIKEVFGSKKNEES